MFTVPDWDNEQKDICQTAKKKKEFKGSFVLSPCFKAKLLNLQQKPSENRKKADFNKELPVLTKPKINKKLINLESGKNKIKIPQTLNKKNKNRKDRNSSKVTSKHATLGISPKIVASQENKSPHKKIEKTTQNKSKNSQLRTIAIKKSNIEFKKKKLKEAFKNLLEKDEGSNRRNLEVLDNSAKLRARMMDKLNAARFRYLNEKLYLTDGQEAHTMFKEDPDAFKIYHDGYRQQLKKWPINPLDVIVKDFKKIAKNAKVADLGCGEGALAQQVTQAVRSFDLVSTKPHVEVCDMARTPLLTAEMDVVVYCLALMGTNLKEFLIEANRILKIGGVMKIAEVESRFEDVNSFINDVEKFGFQNIKVNDSHSVFYFFDFKKVRDIGKNRSRLPKLQLKACLYKKR